MSLHVPAVHFFLLSRRISLYGYTTVSAKRYLVYFLVKVSMNKAAINTHTQVFVCTNVLDSLEIAGHLMSV